MVTRWDPSSRAGAVAVRAKSGLDLEAVKAMSESVQDWARYQNLEGETDSVESSSESGTYDWKAYLHEETKLAQQREGIRKPKRVEAAGSTAPNVFYN